LLQIYTSFVFQGPLVLRNILLDLQRLFVRDGIKNVREIIGSSKV
jgi:dihydroorotate dehydrogenase